MDPEPGRCRRTDGKKWRCSRDVVAGQKYCERHVHRGRNRSRKPVEIHTPNTSTTTTTTNNNTNTTTAGCGGTLKATNPMVASSLATVVGGTPFALSGPSPSIDLLHLNQRYKLIFLFQLLGFITVHCLTKIMDWRIINTRMCYILINGYYN